MRKVSKRLVFYISGFDPRGAAYYHGLYQREGAKQAGLTGVRIETGPRHREGDLVSAWDIEADDGQGSVHTTFRFLRWDDIVRANWTRDRAKLIGEIYRTFWNSLRSGHLGRMRALSWPFAATALVPVAQVSGSILAGLLLMLLIGLIGAKIAALPLWVAWALAGACGGLALLALLNLCEKTNAFWLARLLSASMRYAEGKLPQIDARCREFAEIIANCLARENCDEVILVGHSVGSELAVQTVARLIERDAALGRDGAKFGLLTLGQTIPGHGQLPEASSFRAALLAVATAPHVDWIDFSAPPDPACFALVDPVAACSLNRPEGVDEKPKLLSPRFARLFDQAHYSELKRSKMTMHFMYLLASDKPGDYDYFAITAGSKTLAKRYAHLETVRDFGRLKGGRKRGGSE